MANERAVVIEAVTSSRFHEGIPRLMKRKRPPKIDIPNVLREICADMVMVQGDGGVCFSASGVGVAVSALKGKKKFMEDAHKIFPFSNGGNTTSNMEFYGVYDGHGGSKAAEFVAGNLHLKILEMLETCSIKEKEKAIKEGYLKTDEEFLKQGLSSGACCVTALIQGKEMAVSNLGDCRAVLCRDGVAEAITTDHKPEREDERRRIQDNGGYVEIHRGTWRVDGTLAVSRSIGDAHLKDWVLAEPDTKVISLTNDMEYLVLASDGLWGEVSNQEAVDIVRQSCSSSKKLSTSGSPSSKSKRIFHHKETQEGQEHRAQRFSLMKVKTRVPKDENDVLGERSMLSACKELVNLAVARGSLDDITVMVVDLSRYKGSLSC